MKDVFTHGIVHPRDAIPAVAASETRLRKLTYIYIGNLRIFPLQTYVYLHDKLPYVSIATYVYFNRNLRIFPSKLPYVSAPISVSTPFNICTLRET